MKKLVTTIVLAGLVTGVAIADPFNAGNRYSEERMQKKLEHRVEKMSEALELNQEQKDQVLAVMKEQMEKRKTFMQAHKQETEQRMEAIIGADAIATMKAMRAEHKQGRHGGMCDKPNAE